MNVTLRQLQAFVQISRLGSFVAASQAMHVTASALSILIAEMEETMGFRVLDRTTRRVRLSAAGEQYFPYAERVLQDLENAHRCAQDLRSQKTGVVRIATSQLIAWTLMPPLFSAFRAFRPEVRIEPLDLSVDQILPWLEAGRADLALTLHSDDSDELSSVPAFGSRVHLACHAEHRWASRKRLRWAELSTEPLIFTGLDTPQRINAALHQGPKLEAAWQVEHTGTALSLAASSFGSAICAGYVRPMASMHKLRMIPLVEPAVVRQFSIFSSRHRALTPAVAGFRDFLIEGFQRSRAPFVEDGHTV